MFELFYYKIKINREQETIKKIRNVKTAYNEKKFGNYFNVNSRMKIVPLN